MSLFFILYPLHFLSVPVKYEHTKKFNEVVSADKGVQQLIATIDIMSIFIF